jgi:hypothetical protein
MFVQCLCQCGTREKGEEKDRQIMRVVGDFQLSGQAQDGAAVGAGNLTSARIRYGLWRFDGLLCVLKGYDPGLCTKIDP